MRKTLLLAVMSVAALWVGEAPANSCGDKLLQMGRGVRFQLRPAAHPASVVIFAAPKHVAASSKSEGDLPGKLKKAGHKVTVVTDLPALDDLLRSGQIDVVVAAFADAASIESHIKTAPSPPNLLPIVVQGSADEKLVRQQYRHFVKAPGKPNHYISAIDKTMGDRLKGNKTGGT
ncbi:MAG TPA: hypothetical protein VGC53_02030 [Vicinamibacteria bacterium]